MKRVVIIAMLFSCLISCKEKKFVDESGFYYMVEENDTLIVMESKIQPKREGHELEGAKKLGFVPDEETAIKIAESVWYPIYGSDVYTELPFKAEAEGDSAWFVHGTLPKGFIGGTCEIRIRRSDGKILYVGHQL